ncbi:MAG TPA: apolipoprotein N-acyltransferase [Acetobacteraceae bacterium]|nr:apolipoprotein N-acyltransferase [Acetobacteraceae bacterium]
MLARLTSLSGWHADAAAAVMGAMSAAALPPVYAIPVLVVTVPGLLALVAGTGGWGQALRRGWWFGFGHHLLGLYWITEAILVEAAHFWWLVPLAVPGLAAVLALFIAVPVALARSASPGWPRAFTLAGAWVLADLARQFIATGFPWNPWGSVWELPGLVGDVMIQPAAWIGASGLTFLTVLLAAIAALGWRWRIAGATVLAIWATFGVVRLRDPVPTAPSLKVVLVQGDIAQGQKWDRALVERIFSRYLALTAAGVARSAGTPAVVVWPETASPFLLQTDAAARAAIADAADRAPALVGAVRFDADGRPRNSLFAVLGDGRLDGVYDKWHLVPFGEYQPTWLPLPIQVVPGGGFQPGGGPRTLHVPGLPPIGPLICYEAIFSGEVIDKADRPAWMVNITNDAWFGNSTGPRQHLAAARLRAVEEGLPLMRAANTGISAGFDARGHEIGRLGMNRQGVLVVDLPPALPAPPFARYGLVIPLILGAITTLVGLVAGRGRRARPHTTR